MARQCADWLKSFMEYSSFGEAPPHMYFWTGVSAIAGALRKHVWIDQIYFKWYPNFYIIVVAPPGIVSKTTTTGIGMELLRAVPTIQFGPAVVTWEALVQQFGCAAETFDVGDEPHTMSPITVESGEFGNLFDPKDRKMVDIFVSLWDSKDGPFEKSTKMSGKDIVMSPFFNLIACTTPSWIAENFSRYLIGGGFTSRAMFIYAENKHKFRAYPARAIKESGVNLKELKSKLIQDLEHIAINIIGEYELTEDAYKWGEEWYEDHYTTKIRQFDGTIFGGYVARKQSHIHKLAMVLAAATSDELIITKEHLQVANDMVSDLEPDMHHVFTQIGKTDNALNVDKLLGVIKRANGISYQDAYREVYSYFPGAKEFQEVIDGATRAGFITVKPVNNKPMLYPGPSLLAA